jgi:hypothetical protein
MSLPNPINLDRMLEWQSGNEKSVAALNGKKSYDVTQAASDI